MVAPTSWLLVSAAFCARRWPLTAIPWRLRKTALTLARQYGTELGNRQVRTRYGFALALDLSDWLGQHVYATGDYEPYTSHVIHSLLKSGDTFIDIGANIGYFSLLAASKVGPQGTVYCFEPIPHIREQLIANLALNNYTSAHVRPEALSDTEGQSLFYLGPSTHRGISSLREFKEASEAIHVTTIRLDSLQINTPVHFIKMDIEGAEGCALRGMSGLLSSYHPDLVIEMSNPYLAHFGDSGTTIDRFLRSYGYRGYVISQDSLVELSAADLESNHQFNALFTCREKIPKSLRVKTPTGKSLII
jgi:FkbM family methyltransferase